MSELYKNIKKRRLEMGYTQDKLARLVGYTDRSSIAKIEKGEVDISQSKLQTLADALACNVNDLVYIDDSNLKPIPTTRKIPLLGKIACGTPITAIEHPEEYVDVPEFVKADFALLCQGDSMINARILDGDIVYIRRQASVENGEIAAVLVDGEATLKRVFYSAGAVTLIAENPAFPPLVFAGSAAADLQILGKATYFVSKAR